MGSAPFASAAAARSHPLGARYPGGGTRVAVWDPVEMRKPLALALLVVCSIGTWGCGDGAGSGAASSTTRPSSATTTTSTTPPPTDGTGSVPVAPAEGVVWPPPGASTTYTDPIEAVRAFAVGYAGYFEVHVGQFRELADGGGEVDLRANTTGGPVTTVRLRRVTSGPEWSVVSASSPNLVPSAPTPSGVVTSPLRVTGSSTAFEATINLSIRDANGGPLDEAMAMGGSMGDMGPFEATLTFGSTRTSTGTIELHTISMADGGTAEITAFPVRFGA